jgi:hypothetical protein
MNKNMSFTPELSFSSLSLLRMIAIKGMREQAYKFAFGWKGGMKGCYTRGCEIFAPLEHAISDLTITPMIKAKAQGGKQ